MLLHAAVIAGAWQASWRLELPAELPTATAKVEQPAFEHEPFDPLLPMALAPTPIEPPPESPATDPVVAEDELDVVDPPRLDQDPDAVLRPLPPLDRDLSRLRRRTPPIAPPAAPAAESPPIATEPAPSANDPVTPPPPAEAAAEPIDASEAMTLAAPAPVYPRRAIEQRIEGEVTLLALVRADGSVGACEVETSSGHALLDAAAKSALLRWRFKPRWRNGEARPFTARVPFRFTIPH